MQQREHGIGLPGTVSTSSSFVSRAFLLFFLSISQALTDPWQFCQRLEHSQLTQAVVERKATVATLSARLAAGNDDSVGITPSKSKLGERVPAGLRPAEILRSLPGIGASCKAVESNPGTTGAITHYPQCKRIRQLRL